MSNGKTNKNGDIFKYAKLLPPLSTQEKEALKTSIEKSGVLVPIVVDDEGNILDGRHHRGSP